MGIKFLVTLITLICSQTLFAGVIVTGTRIIFPSDQQAVTVQLANPLEVPALVQGWLDNGDSKTIPDANEVPFILTPPLVQIEPKKGQMIRIIAKDVDQLPIVRDSIYWFNILDIPPVATEKTDENKLQVSIRTRLKLIYRPVKLEMGQEKAFKALKFKYLSDSKEIRVDNPSPYYINFYDLDLKSEKQETFVHTDPVMIAPYASDKFKININFIPVRVGVNLINDYGSNQSYDYNIENIK